MVREVPVLDGGSAVRREAIEALCRRFAVRRLALFGSAARGTADPVSSDLDFLVEFAPPADGNRFRQFMGLKLELEALYGRAVDLVSASAVTNRRFRDAVEHDAVEVYAA